MLQCLSGNSSHSSQPTSQPMGHPSPDPPPSEGWSSCHVFILMAACKVFVELAQRASSRAGHSTDGTPRSGGILSPTNVHREYAYALQSESYKKIWTLFQEERTLERILTDALHPASNRVKEALGRAKPSKLTDLASAYFDESEKATQLFITLQASVCRARAIYAPLLDLLSVLPLDAECLSIAQCRRAHEIFGQFDQHDNPFTGSNTFKPMRDCSLELKEHLISCVQKSRSRVWLVRGATSKPGICLIGTAAVAVVSAAVVTTHYLVVAAAAPCIIPYLPPRKFVERELYRAAQLSEAARVVYALSEHLETVDRLIERLQTTIEGDRRLIQIGLERSSDTGPTFDVLKHLRKSPGDFLQQLDHLVVDICLWFTTVNKARELLFQQICPDQDRADAP